MDTGFKISIIDIKDKKLLETEVVLMEVHEETNLDHFLLADTTFDPSGLVSNKHPHTFKFRSLPVKPGDIIRLHTRKNPEPDKAFLTKKNHTHGTHEYDFFWNLETPVWNNDGDEARLYELKSWHSKKLKEIK